MKEIIFDTTDRASWLETIIDTYNTALEDVVFIFTDNITKADFEPIHLVTLACLIHHLSNKGFAVKASKRNEDVFDYLFNDLKFPQYFKGGKNHVDAADSHTVFNLWRITDGEKEIYAKTIEQYFRKNYFKNKDLSVINISLIEAYYNVFDHANANGNAFSLLQYDERKKIIHVGISDFGRGISQSVKDFDANITDDVVALETAIKDNFTVKSKIHNRGMGLGNILTCAKVARIFCNKAILVLRNKKIRYYETRINYPGTLIYLEIDLDATEEEEVLNEYEL